MNYTREPIIETVISAREGFKLAIRNSKGHGQEEYLVDAVEIVSFGSALFYRSIERPKYFLLPVSDYEVLEAREARVVLKKEQPPTPAERGIKIAGGRETVIKAQREDEAETEESSQLQPPAARREEGAAPQGERRRRDRRRGRRRRGGRDGYEGSTVPGAAEGQQPVDEEAVQPGSEEDLSYFEKEPQSTDHFVAAQPGVPLAIPPPSSLITGIVGRPRDSMIPAVAEESFTADSETASEASETSSQKAAPLDLPSEAEDDIARRRREHQQN